MAVDFRCEKCGKLLSVEASPGSAVKCEHCGKKVTVPAGLASLPRPKVPPNMAGSQPQPPVEPPQRKPANAPNQQAQVPGQVPEPNLEQEEEEEEPGNDAVMVAMGKAMPWVISTFFHMGLFLIFSFLVMLVSGKAAEKPVPFIPSDAAPTKDPGGVPNPGQNDPDMEVSQPRPTESKLWSTSENQLQSTSTSTNTKAAKIIGSAGGGASGGGLAPPGVGGGGLSGPPGNFFGQGGGNAKNYVLVIDKSGSMMPVFGTVKQEMIRLIQNLDESRKFHVIFFNNGKPDENPPESLVAADVEHTLEAVDYLDTRVPMSKDRLSEQGTNPIYALERAFQVLRNAAGGSQIYLLTDGMFDGVHPVRQNDPNHPQLDAANGETLEKRIYANLRKWNQGGKIAIFTYLIEDDDPSAIRVLTNIATQNGGKFRIVKTSE